MKAIIVAVMLIALIALLGCTMPGTPPAQPPEQPPSEPPVQPPFQPPADLNLCYNGKTMEQKNSSCESLTSQELKDNCYLSFADLYKNPLFCQNISDQNKRETCSAKIVPKISDLVLCSASQPPGQPPVEPPPSTSDPVLNALKKQCDSSPVGTQRDDCLVDLAKSSHNANLCGFLEIISKDDCYSQLGIADSNVSICKRITKVEIKNSCLYTVGTAKSDANACILIKEVSFDAIQKRDSCIKTIAVANKDANLCASMSASVADNKYVRDTCYSGVFSQTNDYSLCARMIDKAMKITCLETGIPAITTVTGCKTITYDVNRDICMARIAETDKNYSICYEVQDTNSKRTCFIKMEQFFDKNSSETVCNELSKYPEDKYVCEDKLARATLKYEYCLKINNTLTLDKCLAYVGKTTLDVNVCRKILQTDPSSWDECFMELADKKNDANYCLEIKNQLRMVECIFGLSVELGSLSICDVFPRRYMDTYSPYPMEMMCYKYYSIKKSDTLICNSIRDANVKDACYDKNLEFGTEPSMGLK